MPIHFQEPIPYQASCSSNIEDAISVVFNEISLKVDDQVKKIFSTPGCQLTENQIEQKIMERLIAASSVDLIDLMYNKAHSMGDQYNWLDWWANIESILNKHPDGKNDERIDEILCHNLEKMYHVTDGKVPSDTRIREVLDPINPDDIRKPFKALFSIIQRNSALNGFKFNCRKLKDHYLMAIDGTGLFYSGKCGCNDCCIKNKGKKNEAFYHNILGGCIVHPDQKTVIPFAPESIIRQDGCTKNDCEKNAIKRYFAHVKREHPLLKLVILLDGLYADNPTLTLIKKYGWYYIIVAKDGNHEPIIEAMNTLYDQGEVNHHGIIDKENGVKHKFRFANAADALIKKTRNLLLIKWIEISGSKLSPVQGR